MLIIEIVLVVLLLATLAVAHNPKIGSVPFEIMVTLSLMFLLLQGVK